MKSIPTSYRSRVEIDARALTHNLRVFRKLVKNNVRVMVVVKSNAYGHGLVECAKLFSGRTATGGTTANVVDWLGVDDLDEALALRKSGIKLPLLVLGYTLPARYTEAAKSNISVTVSSIESLRHSLKIENRKLKIHLKLETGLNRQGITETELTEALKFLRTLEHVMLEGAYSHFAGDAPKFTKFSQKQSVSFNRMAKQIENALDRNVIKHIADTAATVLLPQSHLDMVRIGIGSYGLDPFSDPKLTILKKLKLKPALSWYSIIEQVKSVKKGERVGYDL
ncbi:MAG: alanine racemase, partial [Patescibacteria group bacterium]